MKLVPSLGMQRRKPGTVYIAQKCTPVKSLNNRLIVVIKLAWGSTRVTQKWEPHAVSSCVWVDAEEEEGLGCLGLPFIWTSGVLEMLAG